jgi:hypothetical protein
MDSTPGMSEHRLSMREYLFLSLLIGIVTAGISMYVFSIGGGLDYKNMARDTRSWLAGENIYEHYNKIETDAVSYPLTAYMLFVPFVWMPDGIAIGIFMGLGSGILSWLIFKTHQYWYLLIFISGPFVYNLLLAQFAPYAVCLFFSASFLPLILFKPQLTLPFALTQRPNRVGLILTALFLLISLLIYPLWPYDWLKSSHVQNYVGFQPLLLLPLGPLIFLALVRFRERRAWMLVLMALMPQRMLYDQLGVLLVAGNRKQMIFLVLCSWIALPAVWYFNGWGNLPYGWKNWILIGSYIPALIVILLPVIKSVSFIAFDLINHRQGRSHLNMWS